MTSNSVNTRHGAAVALQILNATAMALSTSQTRISTGLKVASASDESAVWSIAQTMRSQNIALDTVSASLNRGVATLGVANAAGSAISDLLAQMQSTVQAASDPSLDAASRASLQQKYQSCAKQVQSYVQNASLNGVNLLNGSTASYNALASSDGTSMIAAQGCNLNLPSSLSGGTAGSNSIASATNYIAAAAANVVTVSQDSVVGITLGNGITSADFQVALAAGGYSARDLRDAINSAASSAGLDPTLFTAAARQLTIRGGAAAVVTFNTGSGDFASADNVSAAFGFTAGVQYSNRQTGAIITTGSGISGAGIRAASTVQLTTDSGSTFTVSLTAGYYTANSLASVINSAYSAAGNAGTAVTVGPNGKLQSSGIDTSGLAALTGTSDLSAAGSVQTLLGGLVQTSAKIAATPFTETGGGIILVSGAEGFNSTTNYTDLIAKIKQSMDNVLKAVGSLGATTNAMAGHATFISRLQDSLTVGIGNLVDADLGKEMSNLAALRTKQQLGLKTQSIANSNSSVLLGLFRSAA